MTNVVINSLTNMYFSRYILEGTLKDKYSVMFYSQKVFLVESFKFSVETLKDDYKKIS